MSDTELIPEVDATASVDPVVADTATPDAAPASTETKPLSLEDAVRAAVEKHNPEDKPEVVKADKPAVAVTPETKPVDPITGREVEAIKAPAGMPVSLRDKWTSVDPQFQKYWVDRERDMATRLNQTADERKLAKEFEDTTRPYEAMLRANNTTATAHAKELFNFSHTMHMGSPQQKAQAIDMLIRRFNPDIQTLSQLAAGQPLQPQQAVEQPKPIDVSGEIEKAMAQREVAALHRDFAADPKHEFFAEESIQQLMSKAISAGFVDGSDYKQLYENAYAFACQQHPEIRQALAERAAKAAVITPTVTPPTKKPTGSIKPSPAGRTVKSTKPMSIDEAVRAAVERHVQG